MPLDKLVEQTGMYLLGISQNECGVLVIMQDQLVQPRLSHNNKDAIQVNGYNLFISHTNKSKLIHKVYKL